LATLDSSSNIFEQATAISAVTIVKTTLAGAAVAPDSLNAGVAGTATVAFTSAVGLPIGSVVKVTFPSDFTVASATLSSATNIGSSSSVAAAGSVVSVTVAGSAVAAGASVSFKLDGVTNPGAKTTGTFALATLDSSSNIFEQATAISAVTIVKTTLAGAAVAPDSLNAGVAGTATVAFTSAVGLPIGSVVKVTFPSDFTVASATLSSATNIGSSSSVAAAGSVVSVTVAGSAVAAGASVSFKLDGVTNPGAKTTGTFALATLDSSSNIFEQATAISAVTIVKTTLAGAAVAPDSLNAGVAGTATVAFTSAVGLPIGSVVKVTFPSDFTVASATLSSATNIGSSSSVAAAGSVVSVTVAGSAVAAGASVSFKLDGVTNPGAKTTGTFALATLDSSSNIFEQATAISAVTIVKTTLAGAAVAPDSLNAGVAGTATVAFTSAVGLPIGSVVKVTFPSDFTV
ncbi:hypothetical protein PHYSODRAFT_440828, partial [Phytophthora sojae]